MSEKLIRCMGRCSHTPGTCTATNAAYQEKARSKTTEQPMTEKQDIVDAERRLRFAVDMSGSMASQSVGVADLRVLLAEITHLRAEAREADHFGQFHAKQARTAEAKLAEAREGLTKAEEIFDWIRGMTPDKPIANMARAGRKKITALLTSLSQPLKED